MLGPCLLKALQNWGDNLFLCWEKQPFLAFCHAGKLNIYSSSSCCWGDNPLFWGDWPAILKQPKMMVLNCCINALPVTSTPEFVTNLLWNTSQQICLGNIRHTLSTYHKMQVRLKQVHPLCHSQLPLFYLQFRNKTELLIISSHCSNGVIFLHYFITGILTWFWTACFILLASQSLKWIGYSLLHSFLNTINIFKQVSILLLLTDQSNPCNYLTFLQFLYWNCSS